MFMPNGIFSVGLLISKMWNKIGSEIGPSLYTASVWLDALQVKHHSDMGLLPATALGSKRNTLPISSHNLPGRQVLKHETWAFVFQLYQGQEETKAELGRFYLLPGDELSRCKTESACWRWSCWWKKKINEESPHGCCQIWLGRSGCWLDRPPCMGGGGGHHKVAVNMRGEGSSPRLLPNVWAMVGEDVDGFSRYRWLIWDGIAHRPHTRRTRANKTDPTENISFWDLPDIPLNI